MTITLHKNLPTHPTHTSFSYRFTIKRCTHSLLPTPYSLLPTPFAIVPRV
ncbi:MAG: hypothetical protein F6J90_16230 [Moorea sp. SIOASIH]|nr:hypothetical protein [Moorena sp. SIOASIH]NEO37790.1 hypothetical protein [Moorena sp. SIOASIH]